MIYLKAGTNVEVPIGPVVAVGDGFTPVTTLSLSTADEAELIKYAGASALTTTSIAGNTMAAITGVDGYYTLDLSTGNVDTEGFLVIAIHDDSLCLPVRHEFMVVNANVYDSLFAAATTDYLQVDTEQVDGSATAAATLAAQMNAYTEGTAQAGAAGSITLASGESATDDYYNGQVVWITSGTGAGQFRVIDDYVGATKVASVSPNWATNPDNTSVYALAGAPASTASPPTVDVTKINGATLTGDGTVGTEWGPA